MDKNELVNQDVENLTRVMKEYEEIGAMKYNKEGDFIGVDESIAPCEGEKYGIKFKFKKYITLDDLRKQLHEGYSNKVIERSILNRALEESNYYEPFYISEDGSRWAYKYKKNDNGKYEVYFCMASDPTMTFLSYIDPDNEDDSKWLATVVTFIECDEDYRQVFQIFKDIYNEKVVS